MFVLRGIDMKYSKNQILVFASVALLLVITMTLSSAYSAVIAKEFLSASQAVAPAPTDGGAPPVNTEPAQTEPTQTEPTTAVVGVVNGQPGDVTPRPTAPVVNTTRPSNTTTTKKDNTEQIKKEAVKLYVDANKKAKSKAKSATLTYRNATNYKDVMETGAFSDIAQFLMKSLLKEEKNLKEVHTANASKAIPPANAASNLKVADVEKATRADKGSYYLVTILMKPETNPKQGYGTGSICTVITEKDIVDATKDFVVVSDIKGEYDGAYCEAKIDKKTGNLIELYTRMPLYLTVSVKPRGQILDFVNPFTGKVGLQFEERWTIAY